MRKKYILPKATVVVLDYKQTLLAGYSLAPIHNGSREDDFWVNFEYNSDDLKQFSE